MDRTEIEREFPSLPVRSVSDEWLGRKNGIAGYNRMMLSAEFYETYRAYEYILICHADAWVFRNDLSAWCRRGFDCVAAPWVRRGIYDLPLLKQYLRYRLRRSMESGRLIRQSLYGKVGNGAFHSAASSASARPAKKYRTEIERFCADDTHLGKRRRLLGGRSRRLPLPPRSGRRSGSLSTPIPATATVCAAERSRWGATPGRNPACGVSGAASFRSDAKRRPHGTGGMPRAGPATTEAAGKHRPAKGRTVRSGKEAPRPQRARSGKAGRGAARSPGGGIRLPRKFPRRNPRPNVLFSEEKRTFAPAMIRGALFDMDGVLVDNTPVHVEAFARFCERYGVTDWRGKLAASYGMGNDDILRRLLPRSSSASAASSRSPPRRSASTAKSRTVHTARGGKLRELLKRLCARRARPSPWSSSGPIENVRFVLDRCGIAKYFGFIVSGDRVRHCKPDPEIYLAAAAGLGLPRPPRCTWSSKDAPAGIESARRAGAGRIVALTTTLPGRAAGRHRRRPHRSRLHPESKTSTKSLVTCFADWHPSHC